MLFCFNTFYYLLIYLNCSLIIKFIMLSLLGILTERCQKYIKFLIFCVYLKHFLFINYLHIVWKVCILLSIDSVVVYE